MSTIFTVDKIHKDAIELLERAGFNFTVDYDKADIVWTGLTPIKTNKIVACPCTGVDHVKAPKIIYLDYKFKETVGLLITSTAEHTLSLMLQLAKKNRVQLFGKTLGIIGYGRIGKQMKQYGIALGMDVKWIDKDSTEEDEIDLLISSDVITVHVPLNDDTTNLINGDKLELMKPNALLINTSRAKIVDDGYLMEYMCTKGIQYANDFGQFKGHPNVIQTNHIGGNCKEAREITDYYIAEQLNKELIP